MVLSKIIGNTLALLHSFRWCHGSIVFGSKTQSSSAYGRQGSTGLLHLALHAAMNEFVKLRKPSMPTKRATLRRRIKGSQLGSSKSNIVTLLLLPGPSLRGRHLISQLGRTQPPSSSVPSFIILSNIHILSPSCNMSLGPHRIWTPNSSHGSSSLLSHIWLPVSKKPVAYILHSVFYTSAWSLPLEPRSVATSFQIEPSLVCLHGPHTEITTPSDPTRTTGDQSDGSKPAKRKRGPWRTRCWLSEPEIKVVLASTLAISRSTSWCRALCAAMMYVLGSPVPQKGFMLGRGFLITDRPDTCRVAQPQGQFPLQIGVAALLLLLSCCYSKKRLSKRLFKLAFYRLSRI